MPYEVRADEARGLVIVSVSGRFESRETAEMVTAARELSAERGWNILYDMRNATPGAMTGDLFWLPRRLPALARPEAARARIALLHPPTFSELAAYWENTFTNAGLQARAFVDEDAAQAWLRV